MFTVLQFQIHILKFKNSGNLIDDKYLAAIHFQ